MGNIRKFFLLLGLIVAGVQSAWAASNVDRKWMNKHADVVNVTAGGVTYEVCHVYWRVGYVDQYAYMGYEGGYKERYITDDDWSLLYTNNLFTMPDDEYYASVVGITGSGAITIPDSITNGGRKYPVTYVGLHTAQTIVEKDTTYYVTSITGGESHFNQKTTTCKYYNYSKTPVSITATNVTKLTVNANVEFKGNFSLTACSSVEFNKDVTFSANVYFNYATSIVFNDYATIYQAGMLACNNATTLKFNGFKHEGKIQCNRLTDIYYQNNLPEYSGSFSNYFTNVSGSQITAHVANKTAAECQTIQSSWAVYSEFAAVVPYTVTNPKYTVQVKIENARVQITYTNNGNTYTLTCEANRNITVDGSSNLIIRPYKTYDNLRLASVTLNGAEIIGNLTGTGTMYDAYTISDINSDVYLAFTGEEKVDVTVKVEASAPQSHFITNSFWVRPNYGQSDNLYANQSATFTLSKYSNFFFEMEEWEDETWGITWQPAAIYVNGKDRTEDITYDMTTWFELESVTGDTEIRVVFEPDCDFVSVVSLGPDLLWTRFDGDVQMIDCASEKYYVPVLKNGDPVIVRTDLLPNQSPDNYDVMYSFNFGRYYLNNLGLDQGGVELTPDGKNFQCKLLPGVKDQDRIIGIYPKATVPSSGTQQTIIRHGGNSEVWYEYEDVDCSAYDGKVNEGEPVQYTLPPLGDDCATYYFISIGLLDGETFKAYRNGVEFTDFFLEGNYDENKKMTYHTFDDSKWKNTEIWPTLRDEATWVIILEETVPGQNKWTVVKTAEVEDAEVRVSPEGGEEETTALTDACTEIDVSNAEYAQLRVKGSVASSTYDLYLNAYTQELAVVKAVKELTGLGLVEAKALVESAPVKVKGFATRAEAEAAMATLTAIEGTQCSVKSPGVGTFVKVLRNGVDVTADMTPDGDYLMMNVDAADLTRTTWIITTEELINRFDTNNDGKVDISDVTKLVNEVLTR